MSTPVSSEISRYLRSLATELTAHAAHTGDESARNQLTALAERVAAEASATDSANPGSAPAETAQTLLDFAADLQTVAAVVREAGTSLADRLAVLAGKLTVLGRRGSRSIGSDDETIRFKK
jgi:phosphoenolpyruvate carboxylase